jgi:hypothetical protein
MTQLQGAEQTAEEHPLLRLKLTANEYRLLADSLLKHIETDSVRSEYFNALVQGLSARAVLAEHRTSQA